MPEEQTKTTLLLVTQSSNTARLVSKHLKEYFRVMTAEDTESAWDSLLEFGEISLVICELELVIDKFGLLERIRSASDSWLAATPLLLMVGENDNDAGRELAFQMGATDFINLPFASSELTARARLHANLYLQHQADPEREVEQPVSAVNLLQQLSQQNFFNSRAQQELSFSQRHRSNLSLCRLKVDNVKAIVAEFDKPTAITAVRAAAGVMQQSLRREDSLCYLGNAEFNLLYPATNGIGATAALNRIIDKLSKSKITIAGNKVSVSLSGAVYSCIASEDIELEAIYAKLDNGISKALEQGGNGVFSANAAASERGFSVDRALKLIASGKTDDLSRYAHPLLLDVLPLLEFADEALGLGMDATCQQLRQQLDSAGDARAGKKVSN